MTSTKPVADASEDFAANLAALRDDVTKLSASISDFLKAQTATTTNSVFSAMDNTQKKVAETAGKAQDRVAEVSSELQATIERNPLAAVLIALGAGILVGMLSRGRK